MEKLKNLKPEKYWQKTLSNEKTRDKNLMEIRIRLKSGDYLASIKKDGEYQRFIYEDGAATLTGRGISKATNEYVNNTEKLPNILSFLKENFKEGTCLIGELYTPSKKNVIREVIGCLPKKAIERQKKIPVYYYVFDIWALNGKRLFDTPFQERVKILNELKTIFDKSSKIQLAEYVDTPEKIFNLIEYCFKNDEEGIVASLKSGLPTPGARTSWKTIKVKKEFTDSLDVFFTGNAKKAKRLYEGKELEHWTYWENIKTGVKTDNKNYYKEYIDGEPFEPITKPYFLNVPGSFEIAIFDESNNKIIPIGFVSSGITDKIRLEFSKNPKIFEKRPALIQGMEFTKELKIRHPKFLQFREDTIDWESCTLEKLKGLN